MIRVLDCIVISGGRFSVEGECLRPALPSWQENAGGDPRCHTAPHCRGRSGTPTPPRSMSASPRTEGGSAVNPRLLLHMRRWTRPCCSAPSPSPPPLSPSASSRAPPSRRQDGQDALQSARRDQQDQLHRSGPWELNDEEARREERVAQPRLRLPRRPGQSSWQPGSGAGKQHECAAASPQKAAGRSPEQIHQPDPRLAEQVRASSEAGQGGGELQRISVFICPVHVALLPPRHCGEEGGGLRTLQTLHTGWQACWLYWDQHTDLCNPAVLLLTLGWRGLNSRAASGLWSRSSSCLDVSSVIARNMTWICCLASVVLSCDGVAINGWLWTQLK